MNIEQEDVKYDSKNDFIVLKARTEPTPKEMKQAFKQIMDMSTIKNSKNVIIDCTKTIKLPSMLNLHIVATYMSKQFLKLMKMNICVAISDDINVESKFFDTVLANRMVHIYLFKTTGEAKDWLLHKE